MTPTTAVVPGVPEIIGGVGGVSMDTAIVKAGSETVCEPSFTLITMPASEPTASVPGVPTNWPVFALNVAHAGLLVIEKVSPLPGAPEALG